MKDKAKQVELPTEKYQAILMRRKKYEARLQLLSHYIRVIEKDTERLEGHFASDWETLLDACYTFKDQYSALHKMYMVKDIMLPVDTVTQMPTRRRNWYLKRLNNFFDDTLTMCVEVEAELNERIAVVREGRKLLYKAEELDDDTL